MTAFARVTSIRRPSARRGLLTTTGRFPAGTINLSRAVASLLFVFMFAACATAEDPSRHRSLTNTQVDWPTSDEFLRVLLMKDFNTQMVTIGTSLLGMCAAVVGTFMLLRKRALVGDVVGHASLPGIGIAFIVMEWWSPGSGKRLPGLLTGAFVAGLTGVICTIAIRRYTRIKEDATLAIVLSIFFGFGIVLFTIIQDMPTGNAAGLNRFIFGKAHAIVDDDLIVIASAAATVLALTLLCFKEFSLLCFDENYAATQGFPVLWLDAALMVLVVGVTVIGLQSVGLILVVALLITPAAAARFWSDNLSTMTIAASLIGALSSWLGVMVSALFPRLAAGAVIVLVGAAFFLLSMFFGKQRGVLRRLFIHWQLRRRVGRLDLMRTVFEYLETNELADPADLATPAIAFDRLLAMRSWSRSRLRRLIARATRAGLLKRTESSGIRLTPKGADEAKRVVRNHRLWEIYLINFADVAPSHVDRQADQIEHILEPDMIRQLETLLRDESPDAEIPPSPHVIDGAVG